MSYQCKYCGGVKFSTYYTKNKKDAIRRRRTCKGCGSLIWTKETIVTSRKVDNA